MQARRCWAHAAGGQDLGFAFPTLHLMVACFYFLSLMTSDASFWWDFLSPGRCWFRCLDRNSSPHLFPLNPIGVYGLSSLRKSGQLDCFRGGNYNCSVLLFQTTENSQLWSIWDTESFQSCCTSKGTTVQTRRGCICLQVHGAWAGVHRMGSKADWAMGLLAPTQVPYDLALIVL